MNSSDAPPVINGPITSVKFSISVFDLIKCRLWVINHNRFLISMNIFFSLLLPLVDWGQLGLKSAGQKIFIFVFTAIVMFCFITVLNVFAQILFTLCGKNQGVLGDHEFEIRDDCLFEKTPVNESSYKWSGFRKIESSPNFFFIYVAGNVVHYIPKSCFSSRKEADQFKELIISRKA